MPHHRCIADLPDLPTQWLWPGRIPRGAVTLMIGDSGRGKSLLTLDIAARVTTGAPWPGGEPGAKPGNVLLLSAEDSLTRTVRTRLVALDANLRRVHYLNAGHWSGPAQEAPYGFTFSKSTAFGSVPAYLHDAIRNDAVHLKAAVESLDDCRLVVLDPLPAYFRDSFGADPDDLMASFGALVSLADATGAAILAVAHRDQVIDTRDQRKHSPMRTLAAMARAIHLVDRLPDESGRNVLIAAKSNLGAAPPPLVYQVTTNALEAPSIEWTPAPPDFIFDGLSPPSATQRDSPGRLTETQRATAWLRGALAAGPVPSRELTQRALAAGFSLRTFGRARAQLGVNVSKTNDSGKSWHCAISDTISPEMEHGQLPDLAALAELADLNLPPLPDLSNADATSEAA
jgi:putative DNA primase/helicase